MKTPPEKPTVTVTTKVKLTLRGQEFIMTMEELKDLHERIGKVVDAGKPQIIHVPVPMPEKRRERPFYPPMPPQWHRPMPEPRYDETFRITCGVDNVVTRNAEAFQPFVEAMKDIPQRAQSLLERAQRRASE